MILASNVLRLHQLGYWNRLLSAGSYVSFVLR
jgi:hypothetical protein